MKFILTLITLSISFYTIGQDLNCCNSDKRIKKILQGNWQMKNVDYDSNYEFSFSGNEEQCLISQVFNNPSLLINEINHKTEIKISKDVMGYYLEWNSELFYWNARILKLKSNKMILEINGSKIEFKKTWPKA